MTDSTRPTTRRRDRQRRTHRRATVTSVLGELLLTAGVVVLLFVAWQMWIGDIIMSAATNQKGEQVSAAWAKSPPPELPPREEGSPGSPPQYAPPLMSAPENGVLWNAQLRVPRWGSDYNVPLAGGVSRPATLDNGWVGVYPNSGMPGQAGNFSVAGHRTTWGKPLNGLDRLRLGDAIVIETPLGWYTYRFRTLEYVKPNAVDVLNPVPQDSSPTPGGRYITLTACSPLYSLAERIVAYGVFENFQPRALGAPASMQAVS